MSGLDRYRSDDRRALEALYRRTLGVEAAERLKLTWQWERRQNPGSRGAVDAPWVVREGTALVGALAPRPVRVSVSGTERRGAWLVNPVVAAERDRQGLHELLLRAAHRDHDVTLASESQRLDTRRAGPPAATGSGDPAVPREATQPARAAPARLAATSEPAGVGGDAADRESRRPPAAAARVGRGRATARHECRRTVDTGR